MSKEIKILVNGIMIWTLKYVIITALILLIIFPQRHSLALGLVFGGTASLISFYLMANYINNAFCGEAKSKYYFISSYLARMLLWTFCLVSALNLNSLDLATTIVGMLAVKIVITIKSTLNKIGLFE